MTEVKIIPRDSSYHFATTDLTLNNIKPLFRNSISCTDGSRLSTLAQKFRENWMKCSPSFRETDDSLTNLTWLFDMSPFSLESDNVGPQKNKFVLDRPAVLTNTKISWQPTHPYAGSLLDPQVRMDYRTKWTGKPPFSYASLICLAMRELGKPKVTLSDIYGWIMANFAYYRHTDSSWQNSVRHNLSLNKCFEKVPREKGERGKGGFWRVNPRHADWLEANLAKCRRAAPPPGPPPPIPRSLLLEKQQEQAAAAAAAAQQVHHHQQQQQQQHHQHQSDAFYLTFSPTANAAGVVSASQPTSTLFQHQPQQQQHQPTTTPSTFICYQPVSMSSIPPEVSNEIEAIAVKSASGQEMQPLFQQTVQLQPPPPQPQPHVRRRKTPPCSMYPPTEPDLIEVMPRKQPQCQSYQMAYSNRKRLALASNSRGHHHRNPMWANSSRRAEDNSGYYGSKSWRIEGSRSSNSQSCLTSRKRRNAEMGPGDAYYQHRRTQQCSNSYQQKSSSNISYFAQSDGMSASSKKRQQESLLTEEQTSLSAISDNVSLPCLDSLPTIAEEPEESFDSSENNATDDFFDFQSVLPWQTEGLDTPEEHSNLTVECETPSQMESANKNSHQASNTSSPSPLASFASFGQSGASSASSNTDSGVASLVNPSDGLDLGPLDLDFDTVSSALNDLVESNNCSIPPIDVDFSDLGNSMPKSLETPPVSSAGGFDSASENRDFGESLWNFDLNNGADEGVFFDSGLSFT